MGEPNVDRMLRGMTSRQLTRWLAFFRWREERDQQRRHLQPDTANVRQQLLDPRKRAGATDNSVRYDEPIPDSAFGE